MEILADDKQKVAYLKARGYRLEPVTEKRKWYKVLPKQTQQHKCGCDCNCSMPVVCHGEPYNPIDVQGLLGETFNPFDNVQKLKSIKKLPEDEKYNGTNGIKSPSNRARQKLGKTPTKKHIEKLRPNVNIGDLSLDQIGSIYDMMTGNDDSRDDNSDNSTRLQRITKLFTSDDSSDDSGDDSSDDSGDDSVDDSGETKMNCNCDKKSDCCSYATDDIPNNILQEGPAGLSGEGCYQQVESLPENMNKEGVVFVPLRENRIGSIEGLKLCSIDYQFYGDHSNILNDSVSVEIWKTDKEDNYSQKLLSWSSEVCADCNEICVNKALSDDYVYFLRFIIPDEILDQDSKSKLLVKTCLFKDCCCGSMTCPTWVNTGQNFNPDTNSDTGGGNNDSPVGDNTDSP